MSRSPLSTCSGPDGGQYYVRIRGGLELPRDTTGISLADSPFDQMSSETRVGGSAIIASGMCSASSTTVGTQSKLSRALRTPERRRLAVHLRFLMEGRDGMGDCSDRATAASLHFKYLMAVRARIEEGVW